MINQATVMLYVADVQKSVDFWQQGFDVTHLETTNLPENFITVKLYLDGVFSIQLFDKEFIKRFSPEVATNTPSILFSTQEIDKLHRSLKSVSPFVSDISDETGTKQFHFSDFDEQFFAVTEEKTR